VPSLRDTQAAFSAAIRSEDARSIAGLVVAGGIAPEERIQIYRNNHRIGALDVMQATYPVILRLGGSEWFRQSVLRYQQRHPSRSGDLQFFGEEYPSFLRADLAGTLHAYFHDVATLEWAYQLVLTAEECGPVDLGVLKAVDPDDYERLRFVPRPALRLVESPFPIFAIWHANQPSLNSPAERPGAEVCPAEIRLDAGASRVLLIRRRDHVELRELSRANSLLLRQFEAGAPLGAAAEAMASEDGDFDLPSCLRELLGLEAIAAILLDDGPVTVGTAGDHR